MEYLFLLNFISFYDPIYIAISVVILSALFSSMILDTLIDLQQREVTDTIANKILKHFETCCNTSSEISETNVQTVGSQKIINWNFNLYFVFLMIRYSILEWCWLHT